MTGARVLSELVVVLGTAAVITVVFQAIHLPVVLGYVLAGLAMGPHVPVPLVADPHLVHTLSELGVILLMFTIGLELRISTLARVGIPAGLTAVFEVGITIVAGALVARALGFAPVEALFAGACVGISSTMIVAKSFEALGWKGAKTEIAFAVLVFEDLIAIVLLAILGGVASGSAAPGVGMTVLKLAGFLAAMLGVGLLVVPRAIRWIASRAHAETLAISALALCFAASALADHAGYSVALGAFLAGVLVAESGKGHDVFELVRPLRDVFAMIFFVSIGMTIVPAELASELPAIGVFTVIVLVIKPVGVALGVFGSGHGVTTSVRTGLALGQIGELSFVIAGIGVTSGVTRGSLLAIAAGVACTTAIASSIIIPRSDGLAAWIAARLPKRVATFASFYESWLGRLRARPPSSRRRYRRPVVIMVLDLAALAAVAIAAPTTAPRLVHAAGIPDAVGSITIIIVGFGVAIPFAISAIRRVAQIARMLALEIIPAPEDLDNDLGRAPRRALRLVFSLAIGGVVLVPLAVATQPFLPGAVVVVPIVVITLALVARRAIGDFDGHLRAGSEVILELLANRAAEPGPHTEPESLGLVEAVLPGFGALVSIPIAASSPAIGRSLADLDLRARTGASVLAIGRGVHGLASPSPTEPLQAGDVLALAGSEAAITAARMLLEPDVSTAIATISLGAHPSGPDPG